MLRGSAASEFRFVYWVPFITSDQVWGNLGTLPRNDPASTRVRGSCRTVSGDAAETSNGDLVKCKPAACVEELHLHQQLQVHKLLAALAKIDIGCTVAAACVCCSEFGIASNSLNVCRPPALRCRF